MFAGAVKPHFVFISRSRGGTNFIGACPWEPLSGSGLWLKSKTKNATKTMGATNARLELRGWLLSWRLRMFDSADEIGQATSVHVTDRHHFEIPSSEPGHMKSRVLRQ
jgi:hypothetical protein